MTEKDNAKDKGTMYFMKYEPYVNEAPEDAPKRRKKK